MAVDPLHDGAAVSKGIRSLPRYQEGGAHGLGSLPQGPSWTRELGIPEGVGGVTIPSAEEFAALSPREQRAYMHLVDFEGLAPVRAAILETPVETPGFSGQRYHDVRKRFAERNPSAPTGPSYSEITGYSADPDSRFQKRGGYLMRPEKRPGSFESYFPDVDVDARDVTDWGEVIPFAEMPSPDFIPDTPTTGSRRGGRMEIEGALYEIMDADITEQEVLQALDDPMYGGAIPVGNDEISERVYARRYIDRMELDAVRRRELDIIIPLTPGGPLADLYRQNERDLLARDRHRGFPDKTPARKGISGLRHRAGQAVRGAGITALKAIRDKLPAIVAAGAATAATSHPVSAAVDIALSPEELGSGELPEESRFSHEEKMKYYDDLANLQRELGVGQRPSFLQSPEWNAHLRASYPTGR